MRTEQVVCMGKEEMLGKYLLEHQLQDSGTDEV
jgi:hypothetical protein